MQPTVRTAVAFAERIMCRHMLRALHTTLAKACSKPLQSRSSNLTGLSCATGQHLGDGAWSRYLKKHNTTGSTVLAASMDVCE